MEKRALGNTDIKVSPMGLGCWAIGGPFWMGDTPLGWGEVDDATSIAAIHRALDLGITLFDGGAPSPSPSAAPSGLVRFPDRPSE